MSANREPVASNICRPRAASVDGKIKLTWIKRTAIFHWDQTDGIGDKPWRFRLLRRTETYFKRNEDYDEYFLGRDAQGAQVIFEGELAPVNQRLFSFVDQSVALHTTYSYFIHPADDRIIGPLGVRVTDPEIYWTYERLNAELASLVEQAGELAALSVAGHTAAGRAIPCLTLGTRGPRLALVGLIHAGESGPELIVPVLRRLAREQRELFARAQVVALPAVNIDGREAQARGCPWYLRQTPAGVDLNRNFPGAWERVDAGYGQYSDDPDTITWRGASPGSAPETKAVMGALTTFPPDVTLSYHALASVAALPAYSPAIAADDAPFQQRCRDLIGAFGSGLFPDQPVHEKWTYPQGSGYGSLGTWLYQQYRTPGFDLELLPPAVQWPAMLQAQRDLIDRPTLEDYRNRHTAAVAALLRLLAR